MSSKVPENCAEQNDLDSALLCLTRWCSWLRHCATSRKVAGSILDGVIEIFHWHKPSGRSMDLGLTQPLREISTRNISCGVKAVGVYSWQPYHHHVLFVLKSGSLNLLEPSGPVQACNGIALPLLLGLKLHLPSPCQNGTVILHVLRTTQTSSDVNTLLLSIGCVELSVYMCLNFIKIFLHLWKIIKSDAHKSGG